jgi:hypothetical protein
LNRCKVAYFYGKRHDSYPMQRSEVCSWKLATSHSFIAWDGSHDIFHENKLPYICSMYDTGQGSLFSWITLWNLCHTLNRCKVAYFHGKRHDSHPMQWRNVR